MMNRVGYGLVAKISVWLTISMFLLVGVGSYFYLKNSDEFILLSEKQKAQMLNDTISELIKTPVALELYDSAQELIEKSIKDNKNVISLNYFDNRRKPILRINNDKSSAEDSCFISVSNVGTHSNRLGTLEICYSWSDYRYFKKELTRQLLIMGAVGLFFIGLIVLGLKILIKPFNEVVKKLDGYNPESMVNIFESKNRNDEIGLIENALYKTMEKAIAYQKNLIHINDNLENLVDIKTHEVKQSSMLLQNSYNRLEMAFDELKKAQEQLIEQEKMASLGALVAGIAHEINTPIGVCVTASSKIESEIKKLKELLKNEPNRGDIGKIGEKLDIGTTIIISNLKRASELIRSFKSIAVDQSSENERVIDIKEYLHNIAKSLEFQLKPKYTLTINAPENVVLKCFAGGLSQVFTNLIMNSINHGFKDRDKGKITVDVKVTEGKINFYYQDDGNGIPKENMKRIFEPFFTTDRQKGTGLGMTIVYNVITQKLKGSILLDENRASGAGFIISVPTT